MSTIDTLMPDGARQTPKTPKRSRFAGERLGAWLFAASFSIGIWGLALKILSPGHPTPAPTSASHHVLLAPSGAADGHATVVWGSDAADSTPGYPITDGVPLTALNSPDGPNQRRD
jgi:hypothetical protein